VKESRTKWSRTRVNPHEMTIIGYEDCDYISHEVTWKFWEDTFGDGKFHGMRMELHVPCRNRIEHLMSQCNHHVPEKLNVACDAITDKELFESVKNCLIGMYRYNRALLEHFEVKCFDFSKHSTGYVNFMSGILSGRQFESKPLIRWETNDPRNKTEECIWNNPFFWRRSIDISWIPSHIINSAIIAWVARMNWYLRSVNKVFLAEQITQRWWLCELWISVVESIF
jgi:hypothetical protein